jgi:hypothetical protein
MNMKGSTHHQGDTRYDTTWVKGQAGSDVPAQVEELHEAQANENSTNHAALWWIPHSAQTK